jgi:hypothetical protein
MKTFTILEQVGFGAQKLKNGFAIKILYRDSVPIMAFVR